MNKSIILAVVGLTSLTASLAVVALGQAKKPSLMDIANGKEAVGNYAIFTGEAGPMNSKADSSEHYIIKMDLASGKSWYLYSAYTAGGPMVSEKWEEIAN